MRAKLLFDQNLSPRLILSLSAAFPHSNHVELIGLGTSGDPAIWTYAKENDFIVVTRDADFADLSTLFGFPPNVVWIRRGNCSTNELEAILLANKARIENLLADQKSGILTLF